jgi:two-component system response regulator PilR (NtrC family)
MLISSSKSMKEVVALAEKAAKYPVNVLILGETGCGKELIARHIHETAFCDTNDKRTFASINCAALPKTLLESELFGYKRGAFTGAYANKKGIIEDSVNGSLLLDDIGDMDKELKQKLLRLLDKKNFYLLGFIFDLVQW